MQFWEISGHALLTDDFIRLTPDQQSKKGGIWNALVSIQHNLFRLHKMALCHVP